MRKYKILAILLAVVLLLSVIPVFTASAEELRITDVDSLKLAAENGGEYTVTEHIAVFETIEVTKDLTLNLKNDIAFLQNDPENPSFNVGFKLSGVTLTINNLGEYGTMHCVNYAFNDLYETAEGCLFKLVGATGKDTKLILNDIQSGTGSTSTWTLFDCETPSGTNKPQIISTARLSTPEGKFITGDFVLKINGGYTSIDPTPYIADNYYAISDWNSGFEIVEISSEYSAEFKKNLDANGDFIIKRYHPSLDNDYELFMVDLDSMFWEEYDDGYVYYMFIDYNKKDDTALVCRSAYNFITGTDTTEYHIEKLSFVYDATVKADVDKVIEKVTKSDNPDDFNWYNVNDLELVNYWLSSADGDSSGTRFINFSSEFKKAFDYKNYSCIISDRLGDGDPFHTAVGGEGLFMQKGIVYGSTHIGAEADHILYVPSDTANTMAAKKTAVQKKLDDFLGKGVVTVEENTVGEALLYRYLWDYYNDRWNKEMFDEAAGPGHTFEKFIKGEYPATWPAGVPHPGDTDPEIWDIFFDEDMGCMYMPEEYTKDSPCFTIKIKNRIYMFRVECDSAKIVDAPKYQGKDTVTNVSVKTDSTSVPLDTEIQVEQLTEGEEYDRIIKALGVKENSTYDIKLYSESAQQYITKLEDGTFEVKLPVSKELEGKKLGVYYVDAKNNITYHEVTVEDGFATFITDHFSTYVLSEIRPEDIANPEKYTDNGKSPATGNNANIILLVALAFVSGATVIYSTKKIKA